MAGRQSPGVDLGRRRGGQSARAGAKTGAILRSPGGIPRHREAVFDQVKCSSGHSQAGPGSQRVSLTRKRSQVQILYRPPGQGHNSQVLARSMRAGGSHPVPALVRFAAAQCARNEGCHSLASASCRPPSGLSRCSRPPRRVAFQHPHARPCAVVLNERLHHGEPIFALARSRLRQDDQLLRGSAQGPRSSLTMYPVVRPGQDRSWS